MSRKLVAFMLVLVLAFTAAVLAAGCGEKKSQAGEKNEEKVEQKKNTGETEGGKEDASRPAGASKTVTMNGRSVMGGWMQHWGYDWEGPVEQEGYVLDYKELDCSTIDTLATSFADNVGGLPPGSVVFFKFCFADFNGSNLKDLERVVDKVITTAREKGLKLIIGNSLPMNRDGGSDELVSEYKAYNAFLEQKASQNPNVWIFDFYGVLAGGDGLLKPGYDTGDSHPNDEGYTALDPSFFSLLEQVYSR